MLLEIFNQVLHQINVEKSKQGGHAENPNTVKKTAYPNRYHQLYSLSLVCRAWNQVANLLLYKNIYVEERGHAFYEYQEPHVKR